MIPGAGRMRAQLAKKDDLYPKQQANAAYGMRLASVQRP